MQLAVSALSQSLSLALSSSTVCAQNIFCIYAKFADSLVDMAAAAAAANDGTDDYDDRSDGGLFVRARTTSAYTPI